MVGDRWKDIEAGNKVGCRSIFINRNYKEKKPSTQFATVKSLSGAFRIIKMINLKNIKSKFFADGANMNDFLILKKNKLIDGFTTNPSLMKAAGIKDYKKFAKAVLNIIRIKPVSFEIFADNTKDIEAQAQKIKTWAPNVFVKIPIINTKNKLNTELIGKLNKQCVKINVTAVITTKQTKNLLKKI